MSDVVIRVVDNRAVVTVAGADALLPLAIAASSEAADRAEAALAAIEDIASGAPDAPSIVNKADKDGGNITDPATFRENLDLDALFEGVFGDATTQAVDTDLSGADVPANLGPLFIGVDASAADGITIDAGKFNFPPGIAARRYRGTAETPTPVMGGDQLGYYDFRGYNANGLGGGRFYNVASIDVVVDGAFVFGDGQPPRTRMRFATCYNDEQARLAMEIVPYSGDVGQGLHIGNLDPDGETTFNPLNFAQPRLYVASKLGGWLSIIDSRQTTGGATAGLRIDLQQGTRSDYFIGMFSGAGANYAEKLSFRGDGSIIQSEGVMRMGLTGNPGFGVPKLHIETVEDDYCFTVAARFPSGPNLAFRTHTLGETNASYLVIGSSGVGTGTLKFSVRGNGDVYSATGYFVGATKVIGAQGAAVANATDSASAITQLNLLLARLRAHGLIAT